MIVSGLIDGGVFCQDMGDVTVSDVSQSSVTAHFFILNRGVQVSEFDETYYPDSNGVFVISGLAELMEAYFARTDLSTLFNPSAGAAAVNETAAVGAVFYQGGEIAGSFTQVFYPSTCRSSLFPSTYKYFLTRFKKRVINTDMPILCSYIYASQSLRAKVAYYDGDTPADVTLTLDVSGAVTGNTIINQFSPADLASQCGVSADNLISVDLMLGEVEGSTFTAIDNISVIFDHHAPMERTVFLFRNCFGVPEVLAMTGKDKRTGELSGTYSWIQRKYRKVATDLVMLHTICSGWIDKVAYNSVQDAIRSEEVYILDGLQIKDQVTITDIILDYEEPRTSPLAAYLTYRIAEKAQDRFERTPDTDIREDGIFDYTFDQSFE